MSIIKKTRIVHGLICGLMLSATVPTQAQECADLFRIEPSKSPQSANDFFREVATFSDATAFATSFASGTAAHPVFTSLVAPGFWNFARLEIARTPPVDRSVEHWLARVQKDALTQTRYRDLDARLNARPRVMTGEERKLAREFGYGAIEGTSHPRTKAQENRDALHAMLAQAQAAYSRKASDEVQVTFERTMRISNGEALISKAQVQAILKDPIEFAIVYAHLNGLVYRAGEAGMMLSPLVPWAGRLDKASMNSLRIIAMMARASISDRVELRRVENLVLETLRQEFAPHIDPTLDAGLAP